MKHAIEGRELLVLDADDVVVRATYHKTCDDRAGLQSQPAGGNRVGVVFLSGLAMTRAGSGDSMVYWADAFAAVGYPSFRLDLPGSGDSSEDPPEDWIQFINRGGNASVAAATMKELVTRFHLSGVVIAGHCSGAVSAIYTAAQAGKECKGLVLMDPYFQLSQTGIKQKVQLRINVWFRNSRVGGMLSNCYDRGKWIRMRLRGNALPENANLPLLRCWKEVASTGMPIFILKAPGFKTQGIEPRVGQFDYFKYVLRAAGRKSRVAVQVVHSANHSFANTAGRAAVRQHVENWLDTRFPGSRSEADAVNARAPDRGDTKEVHKLQEKCLHNSSPLESR